MLDQEEPQLLHSSTKAYRLSFFMPSRSACDGDRGSFGVVVAVSMRSEPLLSSLDLMSSSSNTQAIRRDSVTAGFSGFIGAP